MGGVRGVLGRAVSAPGHLQHGEHILRPAGQDAHNLLSAEPALFHDVLLFSWFGFQSQNCILSRSLFQGAGQHPNRLVRNSMIPSRLTALNFWINRHWSTSNIRGQKLGFV